MYWYRFLCAALVWLAISAPAAAQASTELLVAVHDVQDLPIASITVIIRDSSGAELARAATDAQGTTRFRLSAADIRVAVEGQLASGTRLYQPGNDAQGVAMTIQPGINRLKLLVDTDGMVAPDPLTTWALEEPGVPVETPAETVFPTVPLAATVAPAEATAPPLIAQPSPVVAVAGDTTAGETTPAPAAGESPFGFWFGVIILSVLLIAGVGMVVVMRQWR